jgi:hypothetical protein
MIFILIQIKFDDDINNMMNYWKGEKHKKRPKKKLPTIGIAQQCRAKASLVSKKLCRTHQSTYQDKKYNPSWIGKKHVMSNVLLIRASPAVLST